MIRKNAKFSQMMKMNAEALFTNSGLSENEAAVCSRPTDRSRSSAGCRALSSRKATGATVQNATAAGAGNRMNSR